MRDLFACSSRANDSGKIISGQWNGWSRGIPRFMLAVATSRARNSRMASACVAENTSPQLCDRVKARDASTKREDRLEWRLLRLVNAKSLVSSSFIPWQSRVIRKLRRNVRTMRLYNVIYRKPNTSHIFSNNRIFEIFFSPHFNLKYLLSIFLTSNIKC